MIYYRPLPYSFSKSGQPLLVKCVISFWHCSRNTTMSSRRATSAVQENACLYLGPPVRNICEGVIHALGNRSQGVRKSLEGYCNESAVFKRLCQSCPGRPNTCFSKPQTWTFAWDSLRVFCQLLHWRTLQLYLTTTLEAWRKTQTNNSLSLLRK